MSSYAQTVSRQLAPPVARGDLEVSLTGLTPVMETHGLLIYIFTARTAPLLMREVGRIRECEFRRDGGGTGKSLDIDAYDDPPGDDRPGEDPIFRQLIAWDPEHGQIVSMYRYLPGWLVDPARYHRQLPTGHLFSFSPHFLDDVLPRTIELGRSVVNREAHKRMRGLYAIWSGLGALVREYPRTRYFFGKVTMYPDMDAQARTMIYEFLRTWFPDPDGLLYARESASLHMVPEPAGQQVTGRDSDDTAHEEAFDRALHRLVDDVAARGESVPPLVLSYSRLTPHMRSFGTAVNTRFGNVEETAILVPIDRLRPRIRTKFLDNYESTHPEAFV